MYTLHIFLPTVYVKHQSSVAGAHNINIDADQKMFVTVKYRFFVSMSDFPCKGLIVDRTFDVLQ